MADEERKYSDEEFALILRKASELHTKPGGAEGDAGGISLQEIRAIAREVGIDPAAVDRVAAMLPHEEHPGTVAKLMGGSTRYRLEHTARGRVSEADLARLLDAVRRASGTHGKVEYGPLGFEWSGGDVSQIHVTAVPVDEGTHLRVTVDRGGAAVLTFLFSLMGWMITAGITGGVLAPDSAAVGLGIFLSGVVGGIAQGRVIWAANTKSLRAKLHRIMDALTGAAEKAERKEPEAPPAGGESEEGG